MHLVKEHSSGILVGFSSCILFRHYLVKSIHTRLRSQSLQKASFLLPHLSPVTDSHSPLPPPPNHIFICSFHYIRSRIGVCIIELLISSTYVCIYIYIYIYVPPWINHLLPHHTQRTIHNANPWDPVIDQACIHSCMHKEIDACFPIVEGRIY